jgi:hypothetical protein
MRVRAIVAEFLITTRKFSAAEVLIEVLRRKEPAGRFQMG